MSQSIKAVIFDHDGTLVDSEHSHFLAWNRMLEPHAVQIPEQAYKAHCAGRSTLDTARYIQESLLPNLTADDLYALQRAARDQDSDEAHPLLPGARESVAAMAKWFPLAIATGAERYSIDRTLSAYGWEDTFQAIATTSDVEHPKPAPDVYLLAAEKLGVPTGDCLAIEDSEPGYLSASAAGCRVVLVNSEFSPQDWAPPTLARLESLHDLAAFVGSDHEA